MPSICKLLFIFLFFLTSSKSEKFKCEHSFRSQYSLFMVTSQELFYNKLPMEISYNGISRSGTLFFNMCEDIQLTNVCGKKPVVGKFIFVDHLSNIGRAKCLVFNTLDFLAWDFKALSDGEDGVNARGGIQISNQEMQIQETEPLTRDVLNNLDLGSLTMEVVLPKDEEDFPGIQNKRSNLLQSAIFKKLQNLEKHNSDHIVAVGLNKKLDFEDGKNNFDIPSVDSLKLKGESINLRKSFRILSKSENYNFDKTSKLNINNMVQLKKLRNKIHHLHLSNQNKVSTEFFFSSRRRHTRCREVSWARRCV